ncbi:serine hydrolase domain-containing protein [Zobellia uliginosa]|uniref:serine hydrolase domain-containing protein n=1 Tax=Zobellia uliginosa TaxID=143224 RepID=UPI0026E2C301|nr:serine hydrolase domain-containing protein [Zobellia uliginosa]MDO6519400.1 serine hydrolase domain-containing protein [Zobellia uliginosa]
MKKLTILILILISTATQAQKNKFELLEPKIDSILKQNNVDGFQMVVVSKDSILHQTAFGTKNGNDLPITNETYFNIASITKSFTALGIMMLVEEGKLKLEDKLKDIAPEVEYTNEWEEEYPIRIIHLLEHTTGWDKDQLHQFFYNRNGRSTLEVLQAFPDSRVSRFPPGQFYSYTNDGPSVAGYVIEKLSGLSYEDFITQRILEPLEMYSTTLNTTDERLKGQLATDMGDNNLIYRPVVDMPASGIFTTAGDMANYLQFYLNNGKVDSTQLVKPKTIQRMLYSESTLSSNPIGDHSHSEYGKGVFHYTIKGVPMFSHGGSAPTFGTNFLIINDYDRGVFLAMTNDQFDIVSKVTKLVRNEILYDRKEWKPELDDRLQDESWIGHYRTINSEYAYLRPFEKFFQFYTISKDGEGLHLNEAFNDHKYLLYQNGNERPYFHSPSTKKWSLYRGKDVLGNEVIQRGETDGNWEKISKVKIWFNLILFFTCITLLFSIPFVAIGRWIIAKVKKRKFISSKILRMGLLAITSIVVIVIVGIIYLSGEASGIEDFYDKMETIFSVSWLSLLIFLLTLGFGIFSIGALYFYVKKWKESESKIFNIYLGLITFALMLSTIYLGINGFIGLTTWK